MTMLNEELIVQLAEAKLKIEQLEMEKKTSKKQIQIKVSEKGCIQINGIRKFPITFYKNEIEQIFDMKDDILNFININQTKLKSK